MAGTLILAALLAQSAPTAAGEVQQLDRVKQALTQSPVIAIPADPDTTGKPVFRVRVQAWDFTYKPWEEPHKGISSDVRPSMPLAHYEFLKMVTPEDFRDSTLYPGMIGVTLDIDARLRAIRKWQHQRDERRAREEVGREFAAYLRARAEATRR